MIDPFNPVKITQAATEIEIEEYYQSWRMHESETI